MKTIGLILPDLPDIEGSVYFSNIITGVKQGTDACGYVYKTLLLQDGKSYDNYDFRFREGVDGLIINSWRRFFCDHAFVKRIGLPCAVINDFDENISAYHVYEDSFSGGIQAARYFLAHGHKDMAVITGPEWSRDGQQRYAGFLSELSKTGLKAVSAMGDYDDKKKTIAAFHAVRDMRPEVSALFCCNDKMALWLMEYCLDNNLRCPQDISLIGYDDMPACVNAAAPLTSIRVPVERLSFFAVEGIAEYYRREPAAVSLTGQKKVPVALIPRKSVFKKVGDKGL